MVNVQGNMEDRKRKQYWYIKREWIKTLIKSWDRIYVAY